MFLDQLITLSRFKAFPYHFGHELWCSPGPAGISQQDFHFGRTKVVCSYAIPNIFFDTGQNIFCKTR